MRRWSVGLFIGTQYLAGLRIDHMDLQAKAGDALIRFVAIHGPIAHEPSLHPKAGTRAEKQTCRYLLKLIRLGDLVFDIAQLCTSTLRRWLAFVG